MQLRFIIFILLVYPLFAQSQKYDRDSILLVLNLTEQPSKKIDVLNLLAKLYLDDNPNRSERFARQALFISESINNDLGKAESMFYLGQLDFNKANLENGWYQILNALEIFDKLDDQKWIAKANLLLGEIYLVKYEYENSLDALFKAMNIFLSTNRENKLAETYNLIGLNYYEQRDLNKAFDYLQNGLAIIENQKPNETTSSLYNNIANIYLANKNYNMALQYYNKAISINIILQKNYYLAINYAHIGRTFLETGNADSALYFLKLSLQTSQNESDNYLLSLIKLNMGRFYKTTGDFENASAELLESYEISTKNAIINNLTKASNELSELYAEQNDFEKAYYFYSKFKIISDSLEAIQNTEKVTNHEMKLLFSQEEELRKIEYQKSNLRYFSFVLALLTLLVIIIILYNRSKMRIKPSIAEAETLKLEQDILREKLDFKNRELTTNLMYLVKKNELLNVINGNLQKAKARFSSENQGKIQEVILYLQSNIDPNLWNEFKERFQEIHKDFYTKLNDINSNLSENDKKLCTFIRLNLSTKEIAGITHQNLNSIEVSRTRLRKKLNITNTDINLHNYLSNL